MTDGKKNLKSNTGFRGATLEEVGNSFTGMGSKLTKPELLLHSCCGPCSTAVIERLMRFVRVGSLQKSVQRLFKFVAHHPLSPHSFSIYSFCVVFYHDFLQNTT